MRRCFCLLGLLTSCDTGLRYSGEAVDAMGSATCQEATMHSDLLWITAKVFKRSCTFSACHKGAGSQHGLNLENEEAALASLVGVPAKEQPTLSRVVPTDPDHSYLVIKLGSGDQSLLKEATMPLGGVLMCPEKIDAIRRWIQEGANATPTPDSTPSDAGDLPNATPDATP